MLTSLHATGQGKSAPTTYAAPTLSETGWNLARRIMRLTDIVPRDALDAPLGCAWGICAGGREAGSSGEPGCDGWNAGLAVPDVDVEERV